MKTCACADSACLSFTKAWTQVWPVCVSQCLHARRLLHLYYLFPLSCERIPKRNTGKEDRFILALSFRDFSLPGRKRIADLHTLWWPGSKEGQRQKQTDGDRETETESWREGERGERGGQGEETAIAQPEDMPTVTYFLQQDSNSQSFQNIPK